MVATSVVEVRGSRGKSLGFFAEIEHPNPNSEYVVTRYSAVRGGDEVTVILPASQSPNAGLEVQGYLYGAINELDLTIIELPGHSSTGLEFGDWGRVSTGDPGFAVGQSVDGASSEVAIKGSLAAPQAQHSISNPVNLETLLGRIRMDRSSRPEPQWSDWEAESLG